MSTPARPGLRSLLALLLATLLLGGCTNGSSEPDGDGEPSGGSSTSGTGTEEPGGTDEPAEPEPSVDPTAMENINPCEAVDPQEWRPFVPKAQRDSVRLHPELTTGVTLRQSLGAFILDPTPKYGCVASHPGKDGDEVDAVAWGWFLGDFGPDQVNDILAVAGGDATMRSYAAITTTDFLTVNGYGYYSNEKAGFWVMAADDVLRQFEEGDAAKRQKTTDRLIAVLDALSLRRDDQSRVMLPEACPRPGDPEVRAVIGKATAARGWDDGLGRLQCLFRNADRDRTLRLIAGPLPQEQVDALVADAAKPANDKNRFPVDEGDSGVAIVVPKAGTASSALIHAEELQAVFAAVEIGNLAIRAPAIPRAAVVDLVTSFDESLVAARNGG